jgi:mRNA-degrading endonuclease RelE of RelBE toxin-antitoxin system
MSVRIEWSIRAVRQLLRLERRDQRRIRKAVDKLYGFPATANVRHLVNHSPPYRLRVGNHRVLFSFNDTQRLIIIEAVRKRDEHTY